MLTDCEQEQKYTDTTYTHNSRTIGVVVKNRQEQEYTGFTEMTFMIAMEDNDDWLANNKTWKKWTRLGDGGSLSYAGIDFNNF